MENNKYLAPVLIVGLSFLFIIVSLGVYLSKGKSEFWISRKMRIGALLLTITAIGSQSCSTFPGTASCYDPVIHNSFTLDSLDWQTNKLVIDLNESNQVTGEIESRKGEVFHYEIQDTVSGNVVLNGNLVATDGLFDSSREAFYFNIPNDFEVNTYGLVLSNEGEYGNSYSCLLEVKNSN
jgi:hypothetical protein